MAIPISADVGTVARDEGLLDGTKPRVEGASTTEAPPSPWLLVAAYTAILAFCLTCWAGVIDLAWHWLG